MKYFNIKDLPIKNPIEIIISGRKAGKKAFFQLPVVYKFDTWHYLNWCDAYSLNKNNQRVLQLFKARCDFEIQLAKTKKAIKEALS